MATLPWKVPLGDTSEMIGHESKIFLDAPYGNDHSSGPTHGTLKETNDDFLELALETPAHSGLL